MALFISDLYVERRGLAYVATAVAQSDYTSTVFALHAVGFTHQKALGELARIGDELDVELKTKYVVKL